MDKATFSVRRKISLNESLFNKSFRFTQLQHSNNKKTKNQEGDQNRRSGNY